MVLQSKSNVIYMTREWYAATPQMIFASLKLKKKMCMIVIVLMFTVFAQQSLLELFHKRILKEMYGVYRFIVLLRCIPTVFVLACF